MKIEQLRQAYEYESYDNGIGTIDAPETEHEYAAVLIKKQALFGPVYFLNIRPKGKREDRDRVYAGRIALFGGRRERADRESGEVAARREMEEETGLAVPGTFDKRLFKVYGRDDQGNDNLGYIYLKEYIWRDTSITTGKIKRHIKEQEAKNNIIGKVIKIKRWWPIKYFATSLFFPLNWSRYTPETIGALVADLDLDKSRFLSHKQARITEVRRKKASNRFGPESGPRPRKVCETCGGKRHIIVNGQPQKCTECNGTGTVPMA